MERNSRGCLGPMGALIILAILVGAMTVVALTRADVFKTQPSQKVVSDAYAARARVETEAAQQRLAAELDHANAMNKAEETFGTIWRGLITLGGVALVVGVGAGVGLVGYRGWTYIRDHRGVVRPDRSGQYPIIKRPDGSYYMPGMQTTALLDPASPQPLSPEQQLATYGMATQARIASAQSQQKVFAMSADAERKWIRAAAGLAEPTRKPHDATADVRILGGPAENSHEDEPMGHIVDDGKVQPLNGPSGGPTGGLPGSMPSQMNQPGQPGTNGQADPFAPGMALGPEMTEQEFYARFNNRS